MIAISTLWFVALLVVGLAVMLGGAMVAFAAGMASSGGHNAEEAGGCLALLIGFVGVVCAIVGLSGGFG